MIPEQDIRDLIFAGVRDKKYVAQISAQSEGILSGIEWLIKGCNDIGLHLKGCKKGGAGVIPGGIVATMVGSAKQIAMGEEQLIGWISKPSGIATAAGKAKAAVGEKLKIVCGAWKKMPLPIKELVRQAITDGGIPYRIADMPFLYLDKNYIKALGGVEKTLQSVRVLERGTLVVQLKGAGEELLRDALLAAQGGSNIIMIDTGRREDIERIDSGLRAKGLRNGIQIAFGGSIEIEDLGALKGLPVDIVDIGHAVVDAPLLDMRMDISSEV